MRQLAPLLAVLLCLAVSCKRSEDQAAKQRIFSPEEPVGVAAEAKEPLDARRLEGDAKLSERVLHMPRGEIEQRLGPHRVQTRVQFAWFRGAGLPDGGAEVSISEETTLQQTAKGD